MNNVKHTPGPWKATRRSDLDPVNSYWDIEAGHGCLINGQGFGLTGYVSQVDAMLLAAAPDLLAALIELRDWYAIDPTQCTSLDQFERLAEEFYRETGKLRPGKDVPSLRAETEEDAAERESLWLQWAAARKIALANKVKAAIAKATA